MDRVAEVKWNPYSEGYFQDPYTHLKDCLVNNAIHKGVHGGWIFFRYSDVSKLLRHPDFLVSNLSDYFKSKEEVIFKNSGLCPHLSSGTSLWPMYLNGEIHKRVRVAISKALARSDLDFIIENACSLTISKFKTKTSFNLIDFCTEFIKMVICDLFEIPPTTDLNKLKIFSNRLARSQDLFVSRQEYWDINEAFEWGKAIFDKTEYLNSINQELEDYDLNQEQLYSIFAISVMAAFETSKDNLSLSFLEILKRPNLQSKIDKMEKSELNTLIEELFRFSSPLQFTVRVNRYPFDIEGIGFDKGSKLYLCLASANRDERAFVKPDEIIADRTENPHLAFGGGSHRCLGAQVAKRELQIALKPMTKFISEYELSDEPVWSKQIFMRTAKEIQIKLKGGD